MATMRLGAWAVGLTAVLAVSAALVASVAQADECGTARWHGSSARIGLAFGAPNGFSDPWFVHPLDPWHGADGLYLGVHRSPAPRADCRLAYNRGRCDALGGRPQPAAAGDTLAALGRCGPSYGAAYVRSLQERARWAGLDR